MKNNSYMLYINIFKQLFLLYILVMLLPIVFVLVADVRLVSLLFTYSSSDKFGKSKGKLGCIKVFTSVAAHNYTTRHCKCID